MEPLEKNQANTQVLDHLGLVAAIIKETKLIERIDAYLPVSEAHGAKLTMGERVAAMTLNALGFINTRLYMFPGFLANKPVKQLLGPHIKSEFFTDDALGRCLDAIHEHGVTSLFSNLAFSIGLQYNLLGKSAHIDTTTLSVYGDYEYDEENAPKVTHGYSKDHRPDLKQMTLNLVTTGKAGFPCWMASLDGNASDQKTLHQTAKQVQAFCKQLKEAPSFIYVADSAMYEACLKGDHAIKWLTRVPNRRKEAKFFLDIEERDCNWVALGGGYKVAVATKVIAGVKQRWGLIFSQKAYEREIQSIDKQVKQEQASIGKELQRLSQQAFSCEADAKKALKPYNEKLKYHCLQVSVDCKKNYGKKGRPNKEATPTNSYRVNVRLLCDEQKILALKAKKGRFILATNELDEQVLPNEALLATYKEQQRTEASFRFIKGNNFEVSSVFLKKPSRVAALMMIMTLSLMIYGLVQYKLRKELSESGDSVPDQLGRPTQRPTAQWIFRLFHGVNVLRIQTSNYYQEMVINLTPTLEKIVAYFGTYAMYVYGVDSR